MKWTNKFGRVSRILWPSFSRVPRTLTPGLHNMSVKQCIQYGNRIGKSFDIEFVSNLRAAPTATSLLVSYLLHLNFPPRNQRIVRKV